MSNDCNHEPTEGLAAANCSALRANSVSDHAINRFRERMGKTQSESAIRRHIAGLLYSAEEVIPRTGRKGETRYFQTDGVVFVVQNSVVVTVLYGRDDFTPNVELCDGATK